MPRSRATTLYALMGSGVALAFLGHGILGAKGKESFLDLVTGTYDKVLGGTMSTDTATTIVNVVGWLDIALAMVFAGLVVAAVRHMAIAYSTPAVVLFGWAMVWGFLTALSRFTAGLEGIAVWDVVERGPNYLLPAALVYLIYKSLQDRDSAGERAQRAEPVAEVDQADGRPAVAGRS